MRVQVIRLSRRQVGLSLVYHKLGQHTGRRSAELVPELASRTFERHMRLVAMLFAPVMASELVAAVRSRSRGQRVPIAVTFDDDLASHALLAAPILRRHGITATFFLCGRLDAPIFWWEVLQAAADRNLIEPALHSADVPETVLAGWTGERASIHAVAQALLHVPPATRDRVRTRLQHVLTISGDWERDRYLAPSEMAQLASAGFEIGFHTASHDYLPGLSPKALAKAIDEGRAELGALTGRPVTVLAYPHGGVTPEVATAARAAGFTAAFTTAPEAISDVDDALLLGRLECLGSTGELAGRLSHALRWRPAADRGVA